MNPKNPLDLLPPLPTFSELASHAFAEEAPLVHGETRSQRQVQIVSFTEAEFDAALKSVTPMSGSQVSDEDLGATIAPVWKVEVPAVSTTVGVAGEAESAADSIELSEDALNCYAQAAALRYTYSLDFLTPVGANANSLPRYKNLLSGQRDALFAHLTGRSEIVRDARGNARWLLRDDERRAALLSLLQSGSVLPAVEQSRKDAAEEPRQNQDEEAIVDGAENSEKPKSEGASRIEETLWSYLDLTEPPKLENQDSRQLLLTQQVVNWLYNLTPSLSVPAPERVARQLARETLLQPFRHLTGEWKDGKFISYFAGRKTELEHLYDYLSVLPPQSFRNFVSRVLSGFIDSAWSYVNGEAGHRPLLIHGTGGVGKSTLLAKLLLDHLTETPPKDRFPYVYLDFDVSALNVREPVTMLAEAARQLGEQYPTSQEKCEAARSQWLAAVNRNRSLELDPQERADALTAFAKLLFESESEDAKVSDQFGRKLPFLLIMDTFEEVQYHDRDAVKDVFRFLNALREQVPALHCVLMGRAPLDDLQREFARVESVVLEGDVFGTGMETDFGVIEVPLGDLADGEATTYLMNQGVSDSQLAEDLVAVVGGNPLSLRLIARVLRQGEIDLTSLRKEMEWRPTLSDRLLGRKIPPKALLQGVLFRRILGHIHSKKIQDLAHPGLVLRRITPDLIKEVLAEPCDLAPLDDTQARTYFDALAREVSLVGTDTEPGGQYVLRHRPELRRIMLRLMEADEEKQDQIKQVHQNAVHYYENPARQSQLAKTEGLYHRLMLGDPPHDEGLADDIPTEEGVEAGYVRPPAPEDDPRPVWRAVAEAASELPPAAIAYLSARIQKDLLVPDAVWEIANARDRELMTLGRASRRARERGNLVSALQSLRHDRQNFSVGQLSPLHLIEVALLERLGEFDEALSCARRMLKNLSSEKAGGRVVQYNLLAARIAARAEDDRGSERFLQQAQERMAELVFRHEPQDKTLKSSVVSDSEKAQLSLGSNALRMERQLLRFATDSYRLRPTSRIAEIITTKLTILLGAAADLRQTPVLARYVVSSICAAGVEYFGLPASRPKLLELVREPALLTTLMTRLPKVKLTPVAEVLTDWTVEFQLKKSNLDLKAFGKLGKPPGPNEAVRIHEFWKRRLRDHPDDIANQLPKILESHPISDQRLSALMAALEPEARAEGEDAFEEARRAGDLIPGEGTHLSPKSRKGKKKK